MITTVKRYRLLNLLHVYGDSRCCLHNNLYPDEQAIRLQCRCAWYHSCDDNHLCFVPDCLLLA